MDQFQRCFVKWVADLHDTLEGVVAIDGKTLRRSYDTGSNKAAIHMVPDDPNAIFWGWSLGRPYDSFARIKISKWQGNCI